MEKNDWEENRSFTRGTTKEAQTTPQANSQERGRGPKNKRTNRNLKKNFRRLRKRFKGAPIQKNGTPSKCSGEPRGVGQAGRRARVKKVKHRIDGSQ